MAFRTQNISRDRTDPITIAKIRKGGVIFEIVLRDSDLALEFRSGKNIDLKDILETPKIFSDAKRGELAAHTDMKKWLGTDNEKEVATIILRKGELSLTQEQRKRMFEAKKSKIIDYIQTNAADPKTKLPHPRVRIENAMQQAKIQIDAYKSVEEQLDGIIESLRVILPISLEKVKFIITLPAKYAGSAYSALKGKYKFTSEKWNNDGSVEIKVQIAAGLKIDFFNLANGLTSGEVIIEEEK
ncbi:MAG: ribosome assembly factor SBDS [Nanoarchaeota archaeon]